MFMRSTFLVLASVLAVSAAGCAHCDTCDDFPLNCTAGNCGQIPDMPGEVAMIGPGAGIVESPQPPQGTPAGGPPATTQPGAFNANSGATSTPPISSQPSTPAASPPAAPVAPSGGNP
jgi:hypothetical protein